MNNKHHFSHYRQSDSSDPISQCIPVAPSTLYYPLSCAPLLLMLPPLQTAAMNDLVVNSQLATLIVDNQDTDAATAIVEAARQPAEQVALVEHRQTLLDITSLSHGDDTTVIADVEDAVLLEDWAEHVLDNDRRRRVADEAALLMQLLGEEVDTKVAVLAGLGRGGDANDLARTTLQDQEVADADVVARDGDGVWRAGRTAAALAAAVT